MCSYDHGAGEFQDQAHRQAIAAQNSAAPIAQAKIPALLWFMPLVMSFMVPLRFVCVGTNVDNYRIEGKHYRSNPTNGSIDLANAIVMNTNCGKVWALVVKSTSTNKEASNVNIEQVAVIEGLARAAADLMGSVTSSDKPYIVGNKLLDKIEDELSETADAEEIQALEASNQIKQANINLLADSIHALAVSLEFTSVEVKSAVLLHELTKLARSLKQEAPETPAAVVN